MDGLHYYVGSRGGHNATSVSQVNLLNILYDWVKDAITLSQEVVAVEVDASTMIRRRQIPACAFLFAAQYLPVASSEDTPHFERRPCDGPGGSVACWKSCALSKSYDHTARLSQ